MKIKRQKLLFVAILILVFWVSFIEFEGKNALNTTIEKNNKIEVNQVIKPSTIDDIDVEEPDSGDVWDIGDTHTIQWDCDSYGTSYVNIRLYRGASLAKQIKFGLSSSDGVNSITWKVPNVVEDDNYRIGIQDNYTKIIYYSGYFTIRIKKEIWVKPYIASNYIAGESMRVEWNTAGSIRNVDILLVNQYGQTETIVSQTTNDGEYLWEIPWYHFPGTYQVRIRDSSETDIYDDGSTFSIQFSTAFIIIIISMIGVLIAIISFGIYILIRNQGRIKLELIQEPIKVEKSPNIFVIKANLGRNLNFSPNGHYLIGSSYNYLKIWDSNSGKIVGSYKPRGSKFIISPDNKQVLTEKGEIIELESLQNKEIKRIKGLPSISSLAYSPDGKFFITTTQHKKGIDFRDIKNGAVIKSFPTEHPISTIEFTKDGKFLIGFYQTKVFIWDYSKGILIRTLEMNINPRTYTISPNGNRLYISSYKKVISEWDLNTGQLVHTFKGQMEIITALAVSHDNRYLINGSSDKSVKIWDIPYQNLMTTIEDGENKSIVSLIFHPERKELISSSGQSHFTIWKYDNFIQKEINRRETIRNKIIDLGNQYERLQINEISEECMENEPLCRSLLKQMIDENVIDAKYFETSDSVLFTPGAGKMAARMKTSGESASSALKPRTKEEILSIIRGYEFIGGQVRFKVGLKNNSSYPLTDFKISFEIPDALKWILHEPDYERTGDTIIIPKIGAGEKKAVSLYLEPINCMESPVNATVSYHDEKDQPQALTMTPERISISCPIFFTEEEANLARVKRLQKSLHHHDRKVFPIINSEKTGVLYKSTLSVLKKHDIKLISEDFIEEEKFGELWYYGKTKYKQNVIITYILIDGKNKTLEIDISGDDESQITAFLAEVGGAIRTELIDHGIIKSDDKFYDIKASILTNICPYCMSLLSKECVENYCNKKPAICNTCGTPLN